MLVQNRDTELGLLRLEQDYKAYTNQGFLLQEAAQVATLLLEGEGLAKIREMVLSDNLFQLRAEASRKTIYRALVARLGGAPEMLLELLVSGSVESRRLANLYLVLLKHRLLREFLAEVVLEQQQRLLSHISGIDVRVFFSRKQDQVPEIADWSDATLAKSQRNLLTLLTSAGLLVKNDDAGWNIQGSFVPSGLREVMTAQGHHTLLPLLLDQGSRG